MFVSIRQLVTRGQPNNEKDFLLEIDRNIVLIVLFMLWLSLISIYSSLSYQCIRVL
jgi:hypothetical protein